MHIYNLTSGKQEQVMTIPAHKFQIIPQTYLVNQKAVLAGQLTIQEMKDANQMFYINSFAINQPAFEVYYLTPEQVGVIKTLNFDYVFGSLLENSDFISGLQLLLNVKEKIMMRLDEKTFLQRVEEISGLYLQHIVRLYFQQKSEESKERFISLMDMLMKVECDDILFSTIFDDNGQFFLECLEHFIDYNLINYIPDQGLKKIIKCLEEHKKQKVMSNLFFCLDLKRVNYEIVFQSCLENSLFKALVHLCIYKKELMTPLFQIWNQAMKKERDLLMQESHNDKLKVLSYIIFTLNGKNLKGEQVNSELYQQTIEMIVYWMCESSNLDKLINTDCLGSFRILYTLFEICQKSFPYLVKENLQLVHTCVKIYLNQSYRQKVEVMQIFKSQIRNATKQTGKENYQIEKAYTIFLLNLINLKIALTFEIVLQMIFSLCYNQYTLFQLEPQLLLQSAEEEDLDRLENHKQHADIIEFLHQALLLKMVKVLESLQDPTKTIQNDEMNQLSSLPTLSEFPLVKAYLYFRRNEYTIPFDILLKSSNKLIKQTCFKLFFECLKQLEKTNQQSYLEQLNKFIINHLKELMQLDLDQTRKLIARFSNNFEFQIIEQLSNQPQLQLEYLSYTISQERMNNRKVDNELLKTQIKLLNKLNPRGVLEELKKNDYPLDDVLKICENPKNEEAMAYIFERTGSIQESILIHINLLNAIMVDVLNKVNSYDQVEDECMIVIDKKINEIIEICKRNSKFDSSEDNWYTFLDYFIDFFDKYIHKNDFKYTEMRLKYVKIVGKIFEEIAMNSNLEQRYGELRIGELKESFIKILNNFYYQVNFIQNIRLFIKDGLKKSFKDILRLKLNGTFIFESCACCGQQLFQNASPSQFILFFCGHAQHKHCVAELANSIRCKICAENDFNIDQIFQNKKNKQRQLMTLDSFDNSSNLINTQNETLINPIPLTNILHEKIKLLDKFENSRLQKQKLRQNQLTYADKKRN